jgi:uncharacterized metal-binding protein YceD (DUF177 family)
MTETPKGLPLSHPYNLARLGNAGDAVRFAADSAQLSAIAKWSGILSLESFEVGVDIAKLAPNRFGLTFQLAAQVTQACVVSLEPVSSRLERRFSRELAFVGTSRHREPDDSGPDLVLDGDEEEGPEEIDSLHIDLAVPVLEEFVLSLDPYPRRPGVEFAAKDLDSAPPESPFAVLKTLK